MAIDFRLLTETPYTSSVSTMMQLLQMQQQERMQGKQIASDEAKTMYTTEAQKQMHSQSVGAMNERSQLESQTELEKLSQAAMRDERDFNYKAEQDLIANQREDRKVGLDEQKFGLDFMKADFDQQMKMAEEARAGEKHSWDMFDKQQKETLRQALGQAYQKGGYGAASDVMARAGLTADAMELKAKAQLQDKVRLDMQNTLLDGKKSIIEIENLEKRNQTARIAEASGMVVNDIAATQDEGLRQEKLLNYTYGLRELNGPDLTQYLFNKDGSYNKEGEGVVLQSLVEMAAQDAKSTQNIVKDEGLRRQYSDMLISRYQGGANDVVRTLLGGGSSIDPKEKTSDMKNFEYAKQLRAQGKNEEAAQFEQQAANNGKTVVNVPGYDKETGEVVFPNTRTTQNDVQKELRTNQRMKRELTVVKNNLNKDLLTVQGRAETGIARIADWVGLTSKTQEERIQAAENLFTPVMMLFNSYRKDVTGAAAAVDELKRLREDYVNKGLPPKTFEARWDAIMSGVDRNIDANLQDLGGLRPENPTRSPNNSFRGVMSLPMDASDEELDAALEEAGLL